MNKLYIPALALALAGGGAIAQQATPYLVGHASSKSHTGSSVAPSRPSGAQGARGASFYSEDFSGGGVPAGWTNVDDLTPISDPNVTFVWSDDPTSVAPAALGYVPSAVFNAPGASNGYLWANSDRGLTAAPLNDHLTRLTTDAIDCSGQSSVLLTFQSLIGVYTAGYEAITNVKVKVSTDLSNWTEFVPFPCLETGAAAPPCVRWSANPQSIGLDISSAAANQSTVYIQFEWLGQWEYFWAIDDVELSDVPPYEMVMNYGYTSHTGTGEEYGRVPTPQLNPTMNLGAEVFNFGAEDQTNVVVSVSVENSGGTEVFAASTSVGTMASGETIVTDEDVTLPALAPGLYTATFTITSDNIGSDLDPTNNTRLRTFEVTPDFYTLDGVGIHPPGLESLISIGTNSFTDNEDGLMLLNYYPVREDVTLHGLEILLDGATEVGGFVIVNLFDTASVLADDVSSPLAQSQPTDVTAADITAGKMRVYYEVPVLLTPEGYFVGVTLFSNAGAGTIRVVDDVTVPQPSVASAIYVPNGDQVGTFSNGNALGIRMLLDTNVPVAENDNLEGVTLYPNPTSGILNINTNVFDGYTVEVVDMLGKTVLTSRANGNSTIDLRGQAKGVYAVRINSATGSKVERVTLD